jgi:Flp pilus assembly protein TadB
MNRLVVLSFLFGWAGVALLVAEVRRFSRPSLADRLRVYSPGGMAERRRRSLFSVESFREVIGPVSQALASRVARLFGVSEELGVRLERVHSPFDPTAFRIRQVGWSAAAFGAGALAASVLGLPAVVSLVVLLGSPLLAFLVLEQRVASASSRWQRRIFLELPVLAEQLAMLLAAGFSLGSALNRLAQRGNGACARDLGRVRARMHQGLSAIAALREWADLAQVDALDRLVSVIALNADASDLGRLVSDESRAIRRDVQRDLVQIMERRGQQVWVPVTVATLVPGVIFLAIPFVEALRLFAGS